MSFRMINNIGFRLMQDTSKEFLNGFGILTKSQVRYRRTKHWNPKFKMLRRLKVMKIELPNFREKTRDLTEEEIRSALKEKGLLPHRPWTERQLHISSTGQIFEPYVPPEGDGKVSIITKEGAKQKLQYVEKKSKSMMAVRKIKSYEEDFDPLEFCKQAEKIYVDTHKAMSDKDLDKLKECVTERAYPETIYNIDCKTMHWKYLKNIEVPRIVHARCTDLITKENIFGQITVRFHSQQILAVYDRFGRLMYGSEILAKDVLEYVVFEKHLSNQYGVWRLHDKIIPDWLPPKEPLSFTFKKPDKISEQPLLPKPADKVDKSVIEETSPLNDADKKVAPA